MEETITLADGTVIQHTLTFEAYVGLWVHVLEGMDFSTAVKLFNNKKKTRRIVSDKTTPAKPDGCTVYEGYTDLFSIRAEDNGQIVIGLHKEE
jgi:hypothetical protein